MPYLVAVHFPHHIETSHPKKRHLAKYPKMFDPSPVHLISKLKLTHITINYTYNYTIDFKIKHGLFTETNIIQNQDIINKIIMHGDVQYLGHLQFTGTKLIGHL